MARETWVSIPGQVIPKTQKIVLEASLVNTQHYKVWIKGSNTGKGVGPSPLTRSPTLLTYSLFNSISTLMGYFMPKLSLLKNSVGTF